MLDIINQIIGKAVELQDILTVTWHENGVNEFYSGPPTLKNVFLNHVMNFKLWHVEDIARRRDVDPKVIADCKYEIDVLNHKRTDSYENIDNDFINLLEKYICHDRNIPQNTETIGMILDRLSILSLKIYHMSEQLNIRNQESPDVYIIQNKLNALKIQRKELIAAFKYLITEFINGTKRPLTYKQFKMYNDPSLNPMLQKHNN